MLDRIKPMIPLFARLCLVSTFLEEGFRLTILNEHLSLIIGVYGTYKSILEIVITIVAVGELIGSLMVLLSIKPGIAFVILLVAAIIQVKTVLQLKYASTIYIIFNIAICLLHGVLLVRLYVHVSHGCRS